MKALKSTSNIAKLQIALIAILLLCLAPMPYGYYTFVRIISMIGFAILSYHYYNIDKVKLAVTFGLLSILFQPFIMIALGKELWVIVDVVVAISLAILLIKRNK